MIIRSIFCFVLLLSTLATGLPDRVEAQDTPGEPAQAPVLAGDPAADNGKITLDFKEIELPDLIQTISELTGRNFLYDETVRGKVTIITPSRITLDEAYKLFLTVLNVKGYTVVPSGNVHKIISTKLAKESNLPTIIGPDGSDGEQYITRMVRLEHIDASTMATTVLAPLIPNTSNLVAYPPSNTLIITDSAANIERLMQIVRQLDVPSELDIFEVIVLQHAQAEELASIASEVISQDTSSPTRRRRRANVQAAGGQETSKIIAYERTNALVVMATADDMARIRQIVDELDRPALKESSHINVYYLENADAETLAATLNEILTGIRTETRTRPGQQAEQAGQALGSEGLTITADKPTNSLIVNASPQDYEILRGIIAQLDIKRKQVYVEALILELSMDATQALGASLQGAVEVNGDSVVFGTSNLNTGPAGLGDLAATDNGFPSLLARSINGLLIGGLFNPITTTGPDGETITVPALSALIDLSKVSSDVNILSAPRLLTSDNEEAEIIVGSNVPIITSRLTDTGASTGLAQSVAVERQDVALILRFTPQVTEGNLVRMNVFQEITDIASTSVGNVNEVGPTLTKRQLTNTVLAENGRTVVLGGLIGNNIQKTLSKTPILGDIPLLKWLFRRTSTTERKTNLLVFITPHVVAGPQDLARITQRNQRTLEGFQTEEMKEALPPDYFQEPEAAEPTEVIEPGPIDNHTDGIR